MPPSISTVVPIQTAIIRARILPSEFPRFIPAACGEVWSHFRAAALPKPGRHVALYLPDGTIEVGAEVTAPFPPTERIQLSSLPSGPVATAIHLGPYQRLSTTHTAIRTWCAEHHRTLAGPSWEIYDHWQDAWNSDPSQIRTDVFYLLS